MKTQPRLDATERRGKKKTHWLNGSGSSSLRRRPFKGPSTYLRAPQNETDSDTLVRRRKCCNEWTGEAPARDNDPACLVPPAAMLKNSSRFRCASFACLVLQCFFVFKFPFFVCVLLVLVAVGVSPVCLLKLKNTCVFFSVFSGRSQKRSCLSVIKNITRVC